MKRAVLLCLFVVVTTPAFAQKLPADVCKTLTAARGTGPITSAAQMAAILNQTAWTHRGAGWGLSTKTGGNRCPLPNGAEVACDILQQRDSKLMWDVFVAAGVGEPTTVNCGDTIGAGTDPNRPWMAPIDPGGPDPKDQRIAELERQLASAQSTITSQTARIQSLEDAKVGLENRVTELDGQVAGLTTERDTLKARVAELESKPLPTCRAELRPGWVGRLGIRATCVIVE